MGSNIKDCYALTETLGLIHNLSESGNSMSKKCENLDHLKLKQTSPYHKSKLYLSEALQPQWPMVRSKVKMVTPAFTSLSQFTFTFTNNHPSQ